MKRNLIIFLLVLLMPVTGCMKPTTKRAEISDALVAKEEEKQREIAIARVLQLQQRLGTTSYPLLRASSEFCEEEWKAGSGIELVNRYTFKEKFRDTAVRLYQLTDTVEVLYVVPDSPAHRAGVQKGDLLLKVNDHLVKPGEKAIVIIGRAYNTYDEAMTLNLPEKLRDLNILAIPIDFLPLKSMAGEVSVAHPNMYWKAGQRILCAASMIAKDPRLFGLYVTNFACGPDSYLLKFFSKATEGKPFLTIEIDELGRKNTEIIDKIQSVSDEVIKLAGETEEKEEQDKE